MMWLGELRRQNKRSVPSWQTSAKSCPGAVMDSFMPSEKESVLPSSSMSKQSSVQEFCEAEAIPWTHMDLEQQLDADERIYSKSFQRWKRLEFQSLATILASGSGKDYGLITAAFEAADPLKSGWVSASAFEAVLVRFGVAPDVAHRVPQILQQGVTEVNQNNKGCMNYRSFMTQLDTLLRQGLVAKLGIQPSLVPTTCSATPLTSRRPSITPSAVSGTEELLWTHTKSAPDHMGHLDPDERVYSKSFQRWKRLELRDVARALSEGSGNDYAVIASAFQAADSLNSGWISASAFTDVLVRFGVAPHTAHRIPQVLQQTVAEVNQRGKNNNGCVNYKTFMGELDSILQCKSQLEGLRERWKDAAKRGTMQQRVMNAFRLTPRV